MTMRCRRLFCEQMCFVVCNRMSFMSWPRSTHSVCLHFVNFRGFQAWTILQNCFCFCCGIAEAYLIISLKSPFLSPVLGMKIYKYIFLLSSINSSKIFTDFNWVARDQKLELCFTLKPFDTLLCCFSAVFVVCLLYFASFRFVKSKTFLFFFFLHRKTPFYSPEEFSRGFTQMIHSH